MATLRPGVGAREHEGGRLLLIRDISLGCADVSICVQLQLACWSRTRNKLVEDVIWDCILGLFGDYLHFAMSCAKATVILSEAMLI